MPFGLLAATRHRPVFRLGRTVFVHDPVAYRRALTSVPLDRTAEGTTGGAAGRLAGPDTLFDQHGESHRRARRDAADRLGAAGVERLRPIWTSRLERRLAGLADGSPVDLVTLAAEIAGATAAALLDLSVDPLELASAAREAAAAAARAHLPGPRSLLRRAVPPRAAPDRQSALTPAERAAQRLSDLVGSPLNAVLAVAAINTTVAALPRAAAWASDDELWDADPRALADELLRVTSPTPLLPRVPAVTGTLLPGGRCPVGPGDRMLLITRHAAGAHRRDPDPAGPPSPQQSQLVFGAGPHACPGAALARAQMTDFLAALAPYRPRVVRARADRHSALPGWAVLTVRAGR
ncbi:cytochrome P450 [Actinoplanes sp. NPDC051411]|uniref:cytochrome P450 n=1 Tax=Actinoplanes sp. NPDC051411 TaxID=3155522 RepID=UPI003426CAB5